MVNPTLDVIDRDSNNLRVYAGEGSSLNSLAGH
jgi:hypothetical protein